MIVKETLDDKEFIIEAIRRLVPDSEWHGDSQEDDVSLASIDVQKRALQIVWGKLVEDIIVTGQSGNASAEAIMEKKKDALIDFIATDLQDVLCEVGLRMEIHEDE
jgi:hypothetical protein